MARNTKTPRNAFKAINPVDALKKLCSAVHKTEDEALAIMVKAETAIGNTRGALLQTFARIGTTLTEAHPEGIAQGEFDEAYKASMMQTLQGIHEGKGRDAKTAKMRAGTDYNNMRAALLGFAENIEIPEGCNSYQAYAKHVRDTAPELFNDKPKGAKRGRKAGKVAHKRDMVDVKELSGKRGKDKDIASEILDMLRIAKEQGKLAEVHAFLVELTEDDA